MSNIYNMDFIMAALVILLLIFAHFISDSKINTHRNGLFITYMVLAIADMFMDILTSVIISLHMPQLILTGKILLTLFFILQALVTTSMIFYTDSLRKDRFSVRLNLTRLYCIPMIVMGVLIIANLWTGMIFSFTDKGYYVHGPYYFILYAYAVFCFAAIFANAVMHYRKLEKKVFFIIMEMIAVAVICMSLQIMFNEILMTGFAVGLIVIILLFALHNPYKYMDNLTGLYDISFFRDFVSYLIFRGKSFHVLSLHITNMEYVNSVFGMDEGNRVIMHISRMLVRLSESDNVFRLHNTRFAVVTLSNSQYDELSIKAAAELRELAASDPAFSEVSIRLCRVLDAETLDSGEDIMAYIEHLERNMKSSDGIVSKNATGDTLEGFRYYKEIERFLKQALDEELLEISFQPVFSIKDGCFVSMEALSRLKHPKHGFVSPELFIGIAERSGDISRVSLQQLKKICTVISQHGDQFTGIRSVKINLSPSELLIPGHAGRIRKMIQESGIDPAFFQFELTESTATEYSAILAQSVREFINAGMSICLDDFGSGYANLGAVMKLPFKIIKIDKSLLYGSADDPKMRLFYRSIVSVLMDMGFDIVAEGVETEEELAFIKECGVNCVQGYYFSKPLNTEDLIALLQISEGR